MLVFTTKEEDQLKEMRNPIKKEKKKWQFVEGKNLYIPGQRRYKLDIIKMHLFLSFFLFNIIKNRKLEHYTFLVKIQPSLSAVKSYIQ